MQRAVVKQSTSRLVAQMDTGRTTSGMENRLRPARLPARHVRQRLGSASLPLQQWRHSRHSVANKRINGRTIIRRIDARRAGASDAAH